MSVLRIRHPEYGYVEFHNLSIRQKEILDMLKGEKSLQSSSKNTKFAPIKTDKWLKKQKK